MKKVLLIGCPGSGKTTFGRVLSEKTGLPLVQLDALYPRNNWQTDLSKAELDALIQAELEKPMWIIDGNYNRTLTRRLEYCDTVFYFDLPTLVSLWSAIKRTLRNYGKTREGVSGDCPEVFDKQKLEFFGFIVGFRREHNKNYTRLLLEAKEKGVNVVIFKSRKKANKYIEKMRGET